MQPGAGTPRKARSWKDAQLIISSISLGLTLGLWGLWSAREKHVSGVQDEAVLPERPVTAAPEPEPMLVPGQTLYLMAPAPQSTSTVSNQEQPKRRNRDKGGGGGGGGGGANAGTGSS